MCTCSTAVVEEHKEEISRDSAMEAEVKAAQQRALIPIEERIEQFKAMLAEKEVIFIQLTLFYGRI